MTILDGGGVVRLETMAFGARVHRLWVDVSSGPRNVVLGHASEEEYRHAGDYMGATVGRFANRIAGAMLEIDGRAHRLSANENGTTLHGGAGGFSEQDWAVSARSDRHVEYALTSPDGDQGFPGTVTATASYAVRPDGVDLELTATTDADTVVNLTNHAYFNLAGEGTGTVDDHRLTVPASRYTPAGPGLLPTGSVEAVEGTPLDLRRSTRVGDVVRTRHGQLALARGIDHNLIPDGPIVDGDDLRPVARLEVEDLALDVRSDAPGLQVYTGNFLDGSAIGSSGRAYRQGDGICLEPQAFPNSPNVPAFGAAGLVPGQHYRRRISWTFTVTGTATPHQ